MLFHGHFGKIIFRFVSFLLYFINNFKKLPDVNFGEQTNKNAHKIKKKQKFFHHITIL